MGLLVWEAHKHGTRTVWLGLEVGVLEVCGLRRQDALMENGYLAPASVAAEGGAAGVGSQEERGFQEGEPITGEAHDR